MNLERVAQLRNNLFNLRSLHGFRAETLVPDIAFIGLVDDTLGAADEALQLVAGHRPHRAYAMVRVAFEAAQRLLVLATAEDYVRIGTRAWLYYVGRDEALRIRSLVQSEMANLRKIKRPDNFLGRDMADAVGTAYAVLAKATSSELPADVVEVTRDAYRTLCRDTHACFALNHGG